MDPTPGIFAQRLHHYSSQISFLKKVTQSFIKQPLMKDKSNKEIEKVERVIKAIKKHVKEQKLTDLQVTEVFNSSFRYIDLKLRDILYPVKLQKSDFQLYMIKRHTNQNDPTCGITMNIDTQKHDDRMIIDANLAQVIDIEYHRFSVHSLLLKASEILKNFKYHQVIHENELQVDPLLHGIVKNYNLVPYHNFTHSFSVFSMFYYFAKSQAISKCVSEFQLYFGLVACLCHDLRHDGLNSMYEAKMKSEIAVDFGNIAILEKMHKSVAFQILDGLGDKSPLMTLTAQEKKSAKRIITNCILATDMARHYEYISHLKHTKLQLTRSQDRLFLLQSMTHACDIGNAMLDHENYITWANLVCVQFHQQTIREQTHGIEVTNHMRFESLNYFYKNQASFLNSIVLPMWQILDEQLDERRIKDRLELIGENSKRVVDQMRRNSQCGNAKGSSLAKYLGSLMRELQL